MTTADRIQQMLAETRWLHGLARQLVACDHTAADLVQDTLSTAWRRPPAGAGPVRAWLRTVLLRNWRDKHRRRDRRRRHEHAQASAHEAFAPDPADVVHKAESQRALVAAVLALAEPFRTCVLLRFFDNLPPRVIAARTGVTVSTVNSRLQRALAMLRRHFAERHGERWSSALLPLLAPPSHWLPLLGVPLVPTALKFVPVAVLFVVACWWWQTPEPAPTPAVAAVDRFERLVAAAPTESSVPAAEAASRLDSTPAARAAVSAPDSEMRWHGRVVDAQGAVRPGVQLQIGAGDATIVSGAEGVFEIVGQQGSGTVRSRDPRWSTVMQGLLRQDRVCTIVVAPRLDLGGRVVDASGAPVPRAAVQVHSPTMLGADLGMLLDFSTPCSWRCECDDDGRFHLADVPLVAGASLVAELGGWVPRIVPLPPASTELLELVLERPATSASVIEGLVVDRWGAAVAQARVSAGAAVARSDARGGFALDVAGNATMQRLVAVAPGALPAIFVPERDAAGAPRWPARVVLQLGGPPRTLTGRVTFADGKPAAGAKVWLADPTLVGTEDDVVLAESLLAGEDRPFWNFVLAAADGTFRIDGLSERSYTLRALDGRTLLEHTMHGVQPGPSPIELRLAGSLFDRVRVKILARDRQPIAGAKVVLQRPALEVQVPGGTRDEWATGAAGQSDTNGVVEFTNVPTSGVEVFASGDDILFAGRTIEPGIDPNEFVVTVDRRVHLQVQLSPPFDRVDRCRVLDADGKSMLLRVMRGNAAQTSRSAAVTEGRSHILSLGEGARTLVLLRGDQEVGRIPIDLSPGPVHTANF